MPDRSKKTENAKAKAPYSAGASHRASNIFIRKFDPEMKPWSRRAKPPFFAQEKKSAEVSRWPAIEPIG